MNIKKKESEKLTQRLIEQREHTKYLEQIHKYIISDPEKRENNITYLNCIHFFAFLLLYKTTQTHSHHIRVSIFESFLSFKEIFSLTFLPRKLFL